MGVYRKGKEIKTVSQPKTSSLLSLCLLRPTNARKSIPHLTFYFKYSLK